MEKIINPVLTQESSVRAQSSKQYVQSCSPYVSYFGLLRDVSREQAWEMFGAPSVPAYFARGVQKFAMSFNEFANLDMLVKEESEKQLLFMLESLIQARQLIREIRSESEL
jgi:hypothetical protein